METETPRLKRLKGDYPEWSRLLVRTIGEERSARGVRLELNSVQAQVNAIEEAMAARGLRKLLILKARRTGITTHEQNRAIWECWRAKNKLCLTLAHTKEATGEIFRDVAQFQFQSIPDEFRPRLKTVSQKSLVLAENNSSLHIATAGGQAPGRGGTYSRVHVSEAAYVSPTLMPAMRAGLVEAARRGFYVEESTANGCSGDFYQTARDVLDRGESWMRIARIGRSGWVLIFLPWYLDERNVLPLDGTEPLTPGKIRGGEDGEQVAGEVELIAHAHAEHGHTITPEQLNWRRAKLAAPAERRLFPQEYPSTAEEAFLASGHSRFNGPAVNLGRLACKPPIRQHHDAKGHLQVWTEPDQRLSYMLAADTSAGVPGDDPQYLTIHEPRTFEQVASWRGWMTTAEFGAWCAEWATKYNTALLVVERNNHGHAVLDAVEAAGYPRIYHAEDGKRGWDTNTKTRPMMIDDLADAVDNGHLSGYIHDPMFWRECPIFVRQANGKYAATEGKGSVEGDHDDTIMTEAIAWQTRTAATAVLREDWESGGLLG